MPKKTERGTSWVFSTSMLSQNIKKLKEHPFVSPGIVCYAEQEEEPFCFSSLVQIIQFGTIKFRRIW